MKDLTTKELRTLFSHADALFNKKSFIAHKSFSEIPKDKYFAREIKIGKNKQVYLTDHGLKNFVKVVELLDKRDIFSGQAEFSNIWSAWKATVENWFSDGLQPERGSEVVNAIADRLTPTIRKHNFIVPIFGLELGRNEPFQVGSMSILRDPEPLLDRTGVARNSDDISSIQELNQGNLWLFGSAHGTANVAQRVFSEQATLTVGLIAIAAAARYEGGATAFRIGISMSPEDTLGRAAWMSWDDVENSLTTHYKFARGQPFAVDTELSSVSDDIKMVQLAFAILQKEKKTPLEEAIERAIYWFSDAHRDSSLVMRIVKYWSCVEAFFSLKKEEITHSVSAGLASILVYGGFRYADLSEYKPLKKQISKLYDVRSKAVHSAAHRHVTEENVAQFSQWVAWMIIEIVGLSAQGYTTLAQLKEQVDRLDSISRTIPGEKS
ncbi:HEPN domain-containing protein [Mesorhizobium sp. M1312]|uniref:hypothetical protein n=1 Tax=unclassified Mesorhizobium TaxID=325217 RepID=UPI00333597D8